MKIDRIDNNFMKFGFEGEGKDRMVAGGAMDLIFQLIFS